MMTFNEFAKAVKAMIEKKLKGVTVVANEVEKNNGLKLHGFTIQNGETNVAPCIYLDPYFEKYRLGEMDIADTVDQIVEVCEEHRPTHNLDVSLFTDFSNARDKVRGRLVNTRMNEELLEKIPHRDFLDLSLIYCVEYTCEKTEGIASIRITNDHISMWGVSEEDLYQLVQENMKADDQSMIVSLAELVKGMMQIDDAEFEDSMDLANIPMYVLTNKYKTNGAVELINDNTLRKFSDTLEKDFFILPSSTHEVIMVPAENDSDSGTFAEMVKEVNSTQVLPNEVLSNHVYKYERQSGKLLIAA